MISDRAWAIRPHWARNVDDIASIDPICRCKSRATDTVAGRLPAQEGVSSSLSDAVAAAWSSITAATAINSEGGPIGDPNWCAMRSTSSKSAADRHCDGFSKKTRHDAEDRVAIRQGCSFARAAHGHPCRRWN
jgi:hypothetical protein